MPRVSVIIPVYQVEPYLAKCLDSVLGQSFEDMEIILVNDGSKDGSPRIMAEYALRDSRIRLVHKENGGLSSARNAGLDLAEGTYIAFLDSDDTAEPEWLESTVRAAEETRADQVLYNYCKVSDGKKEGPYLSFPRETLDLEKIGLSTYLYRYWMPYVHGQEAWSKLYRRDLIEKHRLRFAPNRDIFAEDTLFSAMYLMHTRKIAALPQPFINYLQRGDSLMGQGKPQLAERLMCLSVRLCSYARETGRWEEIKNVLPVLCYDTLIGKGIRYDPSTEDIRLAMEKYRHDGEMRSLLQQLRGPLPLLLYTLHTGKGFRTQIRGRLFAQDWLSGRIDRAMARVEGRIGK